ncbi:MAG: hypothetical protein DRP86_06930, partial [Candidatus Neomarinimicrobiota bacterium]
KQAVMRKGRRNSNNAGYLLPDVKCVRLGMKNPVYLLSPSCLNHNERKPFYIQQRESAKKE